MNRVALVHDWLNQLGGAENVLEELVGMMPGAPVYTSIYAPERMPEQYRAWDIRTSFMQRLGAPRTTRVSGFLSTGVQQMDLSGYDLVLSNKSGFCHGVRTKSDRGRATSLLLPDADTIPMAVRPLPPAQADRRRRQQCVAPAAGPAPQVGPGGGAARRPFHRHQQRSPEADPHD